MIPDCIHDCDKCEHYGRECYSTLPYDDYGKEEPKIFSCRICGTRYFDPGEAKQCQRSHEWQNRKGRR